MIIFYHLHSTPLTYNNHPLLIFFKLINIYEEFIEELLQIADVKADSFCKRTGRKYIRCKHEYLNNSKIAILNLIQKNHLILFQIF
jgi:hypothetical protein